ncbi:MAG: hypothetical protein QOD99_2613 [Chthoniobacter sp.]|jgi:membrane associated rhomboid family serine protease|nr:hypothetical protein [Chthoniobacter sp.]
MLGLAKSDDYQPVGWLGRYPVHVATLLVIVHVLTMIATAMAIAFGAQGLLTQLLFSSEAVLNRGTAWQFVTYAFVNGPSLGFAIEMFLLFSFGREVEKFIGRRAFIALYLTLLLLPSCLLCAIGIFLPQFLAGSNSLHFAVFVAFAVIYPNVELLFTIKAKVIAWVLLAIYALQEVSGHEWTRLIVLCASTGAAFGFIARLRYGSDFSLGTLWRKFRPTRRPPVPIPRRPVPRKLPDEEALAAIDPLLDKISAHGLASLTAREREKLERARSALLKKSAH